MNGFFTRAAAVFVGGFLAIVLAAITLAILWGMYAEYQRQREWDRIVDMHTKQPSVGAAATPDNIVTLTATNWKKEVLDSPTPVLAQFWAPWCTVCPRLSPAIERAATKYAGKVKVAKLNIDDAPSIAREYDVDAIPRVLLFHGGVPERIEINADDLPASEASIAAAIARTQQ